MKNLPLLLASALIAATLQAGTPAFTVAPLKIVLEPTTERPFQADATVTQDGRLVYALQGQFFAGDTGLIPPASGKTARSTPWQTLSELVAAYATGDIAAIRNLYTPDSATFFERLEAKPEMRARWLAGIQKMTTIKVLLAYQDGDRVVAFVDAPDGGFVLPFAFEKTGDKYLLCTNAAELGSAFNNISLALANFHMKAAEIVQP